jgi:anti-repressor protein
MNELKIFKHESFGQVRVVEKDGEPWFIASDVAKALGYEKPNNAINEHCKKVNKFSYPNSGQLQPYNIIPQGDVLRLIVRSTLPQAQKIEEWIFDEVVPSVLKHGAYMTPDTIQKALTNPDFIIQLATQLKESQKQVLALTEEKERNAPAVAFTEKVMGGKELIGIGTLAKILANHSKIDFGAIKLHEWLRENDYTMYGKSGIEPKQRSKTNGWMQIGFEETPVGRKSCALVTWKGVLYFVGVFLKLEAKGMSKMRSKQRQLGLGGR